MVLKSASAIIGYTSINFDFHIFMKWLLKSEFTIAKRCFFVWSFTAMYLPTAISSMKTKILVGPHALLEWLKAATHILSHGTNPWTLASVWIALTQCMASSCQKVLKLTLSNYFANILELIGSWLPFLSQ